MTEAIRIAGLSDKTIRRRIASGQIEARMEGNHYLIRTASIMPEPSAGRELIPMALLDRLEALRAELQTEAVERARAETIATFQRERADMERERREKAEAEIERLREELAERDKVAETEIIMSPTDRRRWWQRKP